MRISFAIDVSADVQSYVQAGEILDKITRDLKETIKPGDGDFDIRSFEARHNRVRKYPHDEQAMVSVPDGMATKEVENAGPEIRRRI
jgi:hypothetical protein